MLVASMPLISFSDNSSPIHQVYSGWYHTCVLRCDGKLICFGYGIYGQLGRDSIVNVGDGVIAISTASAVAFNPAKISVPLGSCGTALIMEITLSSGALLGFSPYRTLYTMTVPEPHSTIYIVNVVTSPPDAPVSVNNLVMRSIVSLHHGKMTKVRKRIS